MSNQSRVLNFSEFYTKYSSDKEKSLGDFTQSSSNFETGFDPDTYDQAQIGPNRPVNTGSEMAPPSPTELGGAKMYMPDDSMNAPEEMEPSTEGAETEETGKDLAVPQPEAGANPKKKDHGKKEEKKEKEEKEPAKKEEKNEAIIKTFAQFVNESEYVEDSCPDCGDPLIQGVCRSCEEDPRLQDDDDIWMNDEDEQCPQCGNTSPIEIDGSCSNCGTIILIKGEEEDSCPQCGSAGYSCGCNM